MISIGIDNGNYNTKSSEGTIFPSGYLVSSVPPIGADNCLFYDGKYYDIGAKRAAVQYDKTKDEQTFILTAAAIVRAAAAQGKMEKQMHISVALGVGLPLASYSSMRDSFQSYFLDRGPIVCAYQGHEIIITIDDCRAYPQGWAAYLTKYNEFARYVDMTFVDIGGYTIDLFRTHNGRQVQGSLMSIPTGTITLIKSIQDELMTLDIILADNQISDILRGGSVVHMDAARVLDICQTCRAAYVRDLRNMLRERGIDVRMPIALIGGGADLLREGLEAEMYCVGWLDIFANAKGYKLWLDRDLKM